MKKFKYVKINRSKFRKHRHSFKIGSMRGLTSIPVRFRGYRL